MVTLGVRGIGGYVVLLLKLNISRQIYISFDAARRAESNGTGPVNI